MWQEFLASFGGALGGTVVAVAVAAFLGRKLLDQKLAEKLATYQHGLTEQISRLEADLARFGDVVSRRNEREFAVTEKAWELIVMAVGLAQSAFGPSIERSEFSSLSQRETERAVSELPFDEAGKDAILLEPHDERDAMFAFQKLRYDMERCFDAWGECKNWVVTHQIFMTSNIYLGFVEIQGMMIDDVLAPAKAHVVMAQLLPNAERAVIDRALQGPLVEKMNGLAVSIRRRFRFEDAS